MECVLNLISSKITMLFHLSFVRDTNSGKRPVAVEEELFGYVSVFVSPLLSCLILGKYFSALPLVDDFWLTY